MIIRQKDKGKRSNGKGGHNTADNLILQFDIFDEDIRFCRLFRHDRNKIMHDPDRSFVRRYTLG